MHVWLMQIIVDLHGRHEIKKKLTDFPEFNCRAASRLPKQRSEPVTFKIEMFVFEFSPIIFLTLDLVDPLFPHY